MVEVTKEAADTLRGVSVGDAPLLERLLSMQLENLGASGLDPRSYSLVKIATMISGAAAPQVGMPKVVAAAPEIMVALDLPLDADQM